MDSLDVLKVAVPYLRVPVPNTLLPSLKVIVPVGVPEDDGTAETVAVKVTVRPYLDGLEEDLMVTVEAALFTVYDRGADVLALRLKLPL